MVCLRWLESALSLRDLEDAAGVGKETIRQYLLFLCLNTQHIRPDIPEPKAHSSQTRGSGYSIRQGRVFRLRWGSPCDESSLEKLPQCT